MKLLVFPPEGAPSSAKQAKTVRSETNQKASSSDPPAR
ncbi:unnamed protein product, partial [Amoebophrya sp. A25]|eukprot:GSA25T00027971001.1